MKELSIEEKAQRYDEAIKKFDVILNLNTVKASGTIFVDDVRKILPELKESEDEKIRKDIVFYIAANHKDDGEKARWLYWLEKQGEMDMKSYKAAEDEKREYVGDGFIKCYADFQDFKEGETYWLEYVGNDNYNVRSDNLLGKTYHITPCQLYTVFKKQTWLEKQGEQKPQGKSALEAAKEEKIDNANKVEPKFHEGDWIVHHGTENIYQVVAIIDNQYQLKYGDNYTVQKCSDVDRCSRLWDITKDAKEGDVLEFEDHGRLVVGIVSYINKSTGKVDVYCLLEDNNFKVGVYYALDTINPHPATEEQRDTLMKAMADAGYTFDFEKKELKKIVIPIFNIGDTIAKKHNSDIHDFGAFTITDITGGKYWYNDRIICDITKQDEWEIYEPVRQNSSEWSEEDEREVAVLKAYISSREWSDSHIDRALCIVDELVKKLKSLRPQSTWKPSDEMLEALYRVIPENTMVISEDEMLLDKLYQGLKYGRVLSEK